MPCGRPSVGRQSYVRIKLRRDTHASWIELKASLKLKSDDALARYLLNFSGTTNSSMQGRQFDESIAMTPW